MAEYAYLVAGALIGVVALAVVFIVQARRNNDAEVKRAWWSYVLLWPLLLDADQGKREGKFLTSREWLGWGVVLLIVVLAIAFT